MRTDEFDYSLPEALIAQDPAFPRDSCGLLVLHRKTGEIEHRVFSDIIDYLDPGDLLVANETRVMPARLLGRKAQTGGAVEVLLLRACEPDQTCELHHHRGAAGESALWEGLVKPGRRLKPGAEIHFFDDRDGATAPLMKATVADWASGVQRGERLLRLEAVGDASLSEALHRVGRTPLPPYITHYTGDLEMYQTVFAHDERSAAAPTAGLHFTPELLDRIEQKGIDFKTVELEVGLDTFRTVAEEHVQDHQIHTEWYRVDQSVVDAIERTKRAGGRVVAVGTTSVRSLESAWDESAGRLKAREREATALYILPGYRFRVVDALITNFHVPRSTLMMLVSAFASRDTIMYAYDEAVRRHYRFLSFGDAMLID